MINERLDSLAAAASGRLLHGSPDLLVNGLFSDTRAPVRGGMFVALRGERFDGNRFAREAIEKHGAAAVLLDRPDIANALPRDAGVILVADTREGFLGIAATHRRKLARQIWFGVTGSVGKSTTKEMLAHVLETAGGLKVHKARASFNNAVGLSHTILESTTVYDASVLELGTNHPGEIAQLASVALPNIVLITGAAASHLEAFHTVENVASEKSEILSYQEANDVAVLNGDSPYLHFWMARAKGRVITFGLGEQADLRAKHLRVSSEARADFLVRWGDRIAECRLNVPGVHQVSNALAALAAAVAAGVPLEQAAHALATFEGVARRFSVRNARGVTLIDDAYNANPASFSAALETLKALPAARKFVVAGDMLELGEKAEELHAGLGMELRACGLSGVVTVGKLAALAGAMAVSQGLPRACWQPCLTPEAAAAALGPLLAPGDAVLIKGSHGVHLEKCCEMLAS